MHAHMSRGYSTGDQNPMVSPRSPGVKITLCNTIEKGRLPTSRLPKIFFPTLFIDSYFRFDFFPGDVGAETRKIQFGHNWRGGYFFL